MGLLLLQRMSAPGGRCPGRAGPKSRRVESREAAFRAGVMDLEWAANARAQLQLVFASQSVHMQFRSIECRARSCRLELADDAATPLESTVAELARRMPAAGLDTIWPGR
jgi:hypothetical protein